MHERTLFTRKHYPYLMLAFAATKPTRPGEALEMWQLLREAMIAVLSQENPRFFASTFRRGCDADPEAMDLSPSFIAAALGVGQYGHGGNVP